MCFHSLCADQVIMVHFIQSFGCQNNKAHILTEMFICQEIKFLDFLDRVIPRGKGVLEPVSTAYLRIIPN